MLHQISVFKMFLSIALLFLSATERIENKTEPNPVVPEISCSQINDDRTMKQLLLGTHGYGGLIVDVGCGTGEQTAGLFVDDKFIVQGLNSNGKEIEKARDYVGNINHNGRISFKKWSGEYLPYADNLVNVIFWQKEAGNANLEEIQRVLAPRGVAFIKDNSNWQKVEKMWPGEIDEWPHYRYDAGSTAASNDKKVGPPNQIQWEAGPRFMRSHEIETGLSSLVSANGRIYYILDEGPIGITDARFPSSWSLICRDAFNGIQLWKHSLPEWGWQAWKKGRVNDPNTWLGLRTRPGDVDRLMVANGDNLYVTLSFGAPVSAIDGETGEILRTYKETRGTSEFILSDDLLIAKIKDPEPAVIAVQPKDGEIVWKKQLPVIIDRSLAAVGNQVFFHTRYEMICLDLETGEELWRKETGMRPSAVVASENVVLAMQSSVTLAFSTATGDKLWQAPGTDSRGRYPDIFVSDDLVWSGRPHFDARNIKTGKVLKKMELQKVLESGHHRRCFTDRSTANFMITGERGSEFLNLHGDDHQRHNWLRGPCITGMVPANGLFYVPPHPCFCYPAVRMDGFFALGSGSNNQFRVSERKPAQRLEKGPAFGHSLIDKEGLAADWPTYRKDSQRSGAAATKVSGDMIRLWTAKPGDDLTQPVVAGNKVFVVQKEAGTIHCLDIEDGKFLWNYTVSGPIDSPPTLHNGCVFFGSHDGFVYALRGTDGKLAWRFLAAPEEKQVVSYDRIESAWPVHGSVLLNDDLIYCSAGRSGFIDGGIYLYALHAGTGEIVHQNRLEGPHPDISRASYAFHEDGYRSDLLTTDGNYIYMGRTMLSKELKIMEPERVSLIGNQRGDTLEYQIMPGMRLVATGGLLDNTFFNRTWWMHSYVWPGFHYAQQAPKSGQMLVFDDNNTYTVKHFTTRNRHSPMRFPGRGYLLFSDNNDNEPLYYRGKGGPMPIEWEPELPVETRWSIFQDAAVDKGPGFTRSKPARWKSWIDVRISAMVLADDKLFVAGTPDIVPEDDPLAALEGRMGGVLKVVSSSEGTELAKYKLESEPVFDGLSAAQNKLLIATRNGEIICMGNK